MPAGGVDTEEALVVEISSGKVGGGIISLKSLITKASPASLSLGLIGESWCEGICCWC